MSAANGPLRTPRLIQSRQAHTLLDQQTSNRVIDINNSQPHSANLDTLAGATLTTFGVSLLGYASAAALRSGLSIPTAATGHIARGVAVAAQSAVTLADTTPAGKEWTVDLVIGGVRQDPGLYTCNGTTTCTLSFAMMAGDPWFAIHAHSY